MPSNQGNSGNASTFTSAWQSICVQAVPGSFRQARHTTFSPEPQFSSLKADLVSLQSGRLPYPGVVDSRVSQMVVQVGNGTLSGDNSLDEEPEHGEHGESAQSKKGG
jgi:hypothetical protein